MPTHRALEILPQPDDSTCGPTSLHAVYAFYGDDLPLSQVIAEVSPLETGGTLAVHLAHHALRRGYWARIYTYNLAVFDPTWFEGRIDLAQRLRAQARVKESKRLLHATDAYLEFLDLGGEIRYVDLGPALLRRYLERGCPILTGLSATYLYGCARERGRHKLVYDDAGGEPQGHFVVLCDYDRDTREVLVADPLQDNPRFGAHYYSVGDERVIGAILLGVLTYDANLLVIQPKSDGEVQ
jgi:hypothetical protein